MSITRSSCTLAWTRTPDGRRRLHPFRLAGDWGEAGVDLRYDMLDTLAVGHHPFPGGLPDQLRLFDPAVLQLPLCDHRSHGGAEGHPPGLRQHLPHLRQPELFLPEPRWIRSHLLVRKFSQGLWLAVLFLCLWLDRLTGKPEEPPPDPRRVAGGGFQGEAEMMAQAVKEEHPGQGQQRPASSPSAGSQRPVYGWTG